MIRTQADIVRELEALLALDPRLSKVVDIAGDIPLRRTTPGLAGLIATVIGQQVSTASAHAILGRFAALVDLGDPAAILAAGEETFRAAGLSRGKQRSTIEIAEAVIAGRLDFAHLGTLPSAEAVAMLKPLYGIGIWTAESYLLFAVGHPDVFPAGDLALQVAVARAFDMPERLKEKPLAAMAEAWSPHRSIAARLFWNYYRALTRRDAAPAEREAEAIRTLAEPPSTRGSAAKPGSDKASQRRHDRTP